MMNQHLTLIRRATNAIETALTRNGFAVGYVQDSLRCARRHLKAAKNFTLNGNVEFARIEMANACTHMNIVLGRAT
ncbi:hypothetical protein IVB12_15850 [Bradyrhizobium sp. 179]|uniref:hypothetical protein n=1 Tax=Bradyrhizobium sp. 179 TaxID=2782648 RepID=UPI001FFBCC3A|nr:hypothetical protein [Bradyrhizobium sp. 179]MCK1543390.1 hypothetical protein [Bradyrhizobium sp. 179]